MTPNQDLILRVLEQITHHPETHDQKVWGFEPYCGTAYCVAGHAVALSGLEWRGRDVCSAGRLLGIHECPDGRDYCMLDIELFEPRHTLDDIYRLCAEYLGTSPDVLREKVEALA